MTTITAAVDLNGTTVTMNFIQDDGAKHSLRMTKQEVAAMVQKLQAIQNTMREKQQFIPELKIFRQPSTNRQL